MAYNVTKITDAGARAEVGTFADCLAVRCYLADRGYKVLEFAEDQDNRGCYDVAAARGLEILVLSIEPTKD